MNNREIFDHVKAHLLNQGKPSFRSNVNSYECAYRGDNGLMCAIGCLIKDEFYNVDFEGKTIYQDDEIIKVVESSIGRKLEKSDINLLWELQRIHDFKAYVSCTKDWSKEVENNLNYIEKEFFG